MFPVPVAERYARLPSGTPGVAWPLIVGTTDGLFYFYNNWYELLAQITGERNVDA